MKDPRKVRQTIQAIIAVAVAVIPWLIPALNAYPKLKAVSSGLSVLLALLTNPRLVAVLDAAMPAAGSSAVLPDNDATPVVSPRIVVINQPNTDPTKPAA